LFGLRGWDIFRRGRSFCFECLHLVRGRVLLVSVGRVVLCMLRRKFRLRHQRFQLRHLLRWVLLRWNGELCVLTMRDGHVLDGCRCDANGARPIDRLLFLLSGDLLYGDRGHFFGHMLYVRCRFLRGRGDDIDVFRVSCRQDCSEQRRVGVHRLRCRSIPIEHGDNFLRRVRCRHLSAIDGCLRLCSVLGLSSRHLLSSHRRLFFDIMRRLCCW